MILFGSKKGLMSVPVEERGVLFRSITVIVEILFISLRYFSREILKLNNVRKNVEILVPHGFPAGAHLNACF